MLVSQKISSKLSTGSVSYTAKYCIPGILLSKSGDPVVSEKLKTVSAFTEILNAAPSALLRLILPGTTVNVNLAPDNSPVIVLDPFVGPTVRIPAV